MVVVAAKNCCLGLGPQGGLGLRSSCRWGCTHFPCPTRQPSPSSPSPRGQYLVLWAYLSTQSDLSCCHAWYWWGRRARALSRSGLLARVPEMGALCLFGEGGTNREGWSWAASGTGQPCESCSLGPALQPIPPTVLLHPGLQLGGHWWVSV